MEHYLSCVGFRVDRIKDVGDPVEDGSELNDPGTPLLQQWESMMDKMNIENNQYSSKPFDTSDFECLVPMNDFSSLPPGLSERMTSANTAEVKTLKRPEGIGTAKLALIEAYWRTLIADQVVFGKGSMRMLPADSVKPGRAARSFWRYWSHWHDPPTEPSHDWRVEIGFRMQALGPCVHRKFMVTETG